MFFAPSTGIWISILVITRLKYVVRIRHPFSNTQTCSYQYFKDLCWQYLAKMSYCWYGNTGFQLRTAAGLHPELVLLNPKPARTACRAVWAPPPCQTLCVLCHVAQIRWELEPQTWIFSCCSSVQLISHRTPTDFIFINNYSLAFITVSSQTIILHASILIAQTVYNLWGLIIRKLCKVHFPLQVSKEDSFVFRQIKLLIALCFLQL